MKRKVIKSLLVSTLGVLSIGAVTPIVISSCGEQKQTQVAVEDVKLDKKEINLTKNNQAQLKAEVLSADATNKNVTWSSNSESIATIDQTGLVKAISFRNTTITVVAKDDYDKAAKCAVNVIAKPEPVESVQLNKSEMELIAGETGQLTATVLPENATNKNLDWNVAWVNNKEIIHFVAVWHNRCDFTAISPGTTIITVTTEDGGHIATCKVTVTTAKPVPVKSVQFDKNELDLVASNTGQLTLIIEPEDASNKNVTWSSSNENVATVDQDGLVRAVSVGIATIIVTTLDGGKTATCKIFVRPNINKEGRKIMNKKRKKGSLINWDEEPIDDLLDELWRKIIDPRSR